MSIAINILSAVLKSVVNNKIGNELANELIGISIDGISEKGINVISDFINGEKSKISHILSKENMEFMKISEENVDYVVAEVKNLLSVVEITDEVFRKYKYDSKNLSAFLWNEYCKGESGYIECESDIKMGLFIAAEALIKLMHDSEGFEKDFLIQISNSVDDTNAEIQKISGYIKENFSKLDVSSQMMLDILLMIYELIQEKNMQGNNTKNLNDKDKKFQNNKKEDYIRIWNTELFLHMNNEERPITLEKAFIMPDFKMKECVKGIGFGADDTLDKVIEKFAEYNQTSIMLITGVPGIGKSSITSWIANKYKDDDRCIVLRFRDWEIEDFEKRLIKAIYNTLDCSRKDLECKILVLDGFDEMKSLDVGNGILNNFFNDIKDFDNFKCVITSRPAYINASCFQNVLELKAFDLGKVGYFYETITGNRLENGDKIESDLDVIGIPVILYMAIMSNIDISENLTKPELYNHIFAEKGGIFDRFYNGEVEYSKGKHILRNPENIKKYLEFLRQVAFAMFEKNDLNLQKEEYHVPELESSEGTVSILEFPIKHLFEYSVFNIEFIHKSIYEYFVSEYIFCSISKAVDTNATKEESAGVFGRMFNKNVLSQEIVEFLKFRIESSKLNEMFNEVYDVLEIMLRDGMTYYTGISYKNVVIREKYIFVNMLKIIHLWENLSQELSLSIINYIKENNFPYIKENNLLYIKENNVSRSIRKILVKKIEDDAGKGIEKKEKNWV